MDTAQFNVRIKSGAAGGTGHEHPAKIRGKPQPLPALRAFLFYGISHGFINTPTRVMGGQHYFKLKGWSRE